MSAVDLAPLPLQRPGRQLGLNVVAEGGDESSSCSRASCSYPVFAHQFLGASPGDGIMPATSTSRSTCRAQEPRIGPVIRSFFEPARPARHRRPRWGSQTVHPARHLFREHCGAMQTGVFCRLKERGNTQPSTPEALRGTPSRVKAEIAPHSLAMLLARSRIETIPTTASPSITGRCRNPPKSI